MLNLSGFKVSANNSTPLIKERKTEKDSYVLQMGDVPTMTCKCWKRSGEEITGTRDFKRSRWPSVTVGASRSSSDRDPNARRGATLGPSENHSGAALALPSPPFRHGASAGFKISLVYYVTL